MLFFLNAGFLTCKDNRVSHIKRIMTNLFELIFKLKSFKIHYYRKKYNIENSKLL